MRSTQRGNEATETALCFSGMMSRTQLWRWTVAVASLFPASAGCRLDQAAKHPDEAVVPPPGSVLCGSSHPLSVWKGKNLSGDSCGGSAFERRVPGRVSATIQRVCEQTRRLAGVNGDARPFFTRQACFEYEEEQQAAYVRRCREARNGTWTPSSVQREECERVTRAIGATERSLTAAYSPPRPAFKSLFRRRPAPPSPRWRPLPAPDHSCEDKYVEAIWKGRGDLVGGSPCLEDGRSSNYNRDRIQSVCEGAVISASRNGRAVPPFTQQACGEFVPARRPVEEPAAAPTAAAVEAAGETPVPTSSESEPPAPRAAGLSRDEIAHTVDANWRSIGRDCWSVAPRARSSAVPKNTHVSVSLVVTASGLVRSATARADGLRQLESCIESSVSRWSFPPAQGETFIDLPLVFAGQ
jgi:hypothetical protein